MLADTFLDGIATWLRDTIGIERLEQLQNEISFRTEVDMDALWIKIGLPMTMFDCDGCGQPDSRLNEVYI